MTLTDILQQRLCNQQLLDSAPASIAGLVRHFGAVQAQDYAMAKWAIGCRIDGVRDHDIDEALSKGSIVRTHVLRPTWHFCAAEDVGWMLELSARNIRGQMASHEKKLGLDTATYSKCFDIIGKALTGRQLTRTQLSEILENNPIASRDRMALILFAMEIEGLIVSGGRIGKEHGYALMAERVLKPKQLSREQALAQLAKTYFTSHGPASIRDFQWWSGLNLTDCRKAVAACERDLQQVAIDTQLYYFSEQNNAIKRSALLLPAFDEFLIAYKDRSASIAPAHEKHAFTNNGIFKPIIVVDGQVCGIWKRTFKKTKVVVEFDLVNEIAKNRMPELERQAKRFADFLGVKLELKGAVSR